MGNRTALWLERVDGKPLIVFEANNALPLYWCAALRPADLTSWAEAARGRTPDDAPPLELRLPWRAARDNLRAALAAAPGRAPAHAPRFAAFVTALEAEADRFGAATLVFDAVEWVNFQPRAEDSARDLRGMIEFWHGAGPPLAPVMHWTFEADGVAADPDLERAQEGWPPAPLTPHAAPAPPPATSLQWLRRPWVWFTILMLAALIAVLAI